MVSVMVFGSFDPLHEGHRALFRQAKSLGDTVIVVVSRDESIRRIKQREPAEPEQRRVERVAQEVTVTSAVLGDAEDFLKVVKHHRPNILLLGYDQNTFEEKELSILLARRKLSPKIMRAKSYKPGVYKSSKIKN